MQTLIVTSQPKLWAFAKPYAEVVDSSDYLTNDLYSQSKHYRIINLNTSYRYQSIGYYVSLLAEARQHKAIPSITTIQDLKNPILAKYISLEIDTEIQQTLKTLKSQDFVLSIYFGNSVFKKYERLSAQLHKLFPAPLFRVYFYFHKKWKIKHITPISITDIPDEHVSAFMDYAKAYFTKKRFHAVRLSAKPYDLAILVNPKEKVAPSDGKAVNKFVQAAENLGFSVDLITKDDFNSISEYDALFIRETTSVNHHTYRFARRGIANGLIVIDDPESILKCTNKVYLFELLNKHKIPTPKTYVITKRNKNSFAKKLTYPCVLKLPDSSFSQGVAKVENQEELNLTLTSYFNESELIIAQEYMPTEYDWRIGLMDKKPIYACRYHMVKDHWQILKWQNNIPQESPINDTVAIEDVPENIVKLALRATLPIGDGLYGVDIKQQGDKAYVIEINDNPSIYHGLEDALIGDSLYEIIMRSMLQRIKKKHGYE